MSHSVPSALVALLLLAPLGPAHAFDKVALRLHELTGTSPPGAVLPDKDQIQIRAPLSRSVFWTAADGYVDEVQICVNFGAVSQGSLEGTVEHSHLEFGNQGRGDCVVLRDPKGKGRFTSEKGATILGFDVKVRARRSKDRMRIDYKLAHGSYGLVPFYPLAADGPDYKGEKTLKGEEAWMDVRLSARSTNGGSSISSRSRMRVQLKKGGRDDVLRLDARRMK